MITNCGFWQFSGIHPVTDKGPLSRHCGPWRWIFDRLQWVGNRQSRLPERRSANRLKLPLGSSPGNGSNWRTARRRLERHQFPAGVPGDSPHRRSEKTTVFPHHSSFAMRLSEASIFRSEKPVAEIKVRISQLRTGKTNRDDRRMGLQIGGAPVLPQPESRLQIIWASPVVCRLLADNLGCWQNNVGLRPPILSINLGRKSRCLQAGARMFAGRYSYIMERCTQ